MQMSSPSASSILSTSPYDGSVLAEVPATTPREVAAAVDRARDAQPEWQRRGPVQRAAILVALGRLIHDQRSTLGDLIAKEVGKPLAEATAEVSRTATICAYYGGIGNDLGGDLRRSTEASVMILARQVPVGVAGVITPWNFPAAIPAWKILPALIAGCTVVWKPAPQALATALALTALAREAGVPHDALTLVVGDAEVGQGLTSAPLDALSFTGSSAVGETIRRAVACRPVRLVLELGGVNVAHVLADADIEAAATDITAAAFGFAGQKCTATQVIAADRQIAKELKTALVSRLNTLVVGLPFDPEVTVGPVVDEATALDHRASIAALRRAHETHSAAAPDGGAWVAPTLVIGNRDRLVSAELFGPVCTLLSTDGYGDHEAIAASTPSQLTAAVYGRDADAIRRVINLAHTAVVAVNRPSTGLDPHVSFGGWGASAAGHAEQGHEALRFYTKHQTVYWRANGDGIEFP